MARKTHQQPNHASEQLAKTIALKIIKWQSSLAITLNKWFNQFSKKQQQWLLITFCVLSGCALTLCLLVPYGKMAMNNPMKNDQPMHIGLPSNKPNHAPLKPTDSLTLKK
ncbi:hypothetical protein [Mucilaginibacter sp.]|uniref:hypothetical protein n=1 Tax=Mucilaginibacter sp. TaxID=1882438 RepID=UPI0035BC4DDB